MNLLMISGNSTTAEGKMDAFYYLLEEFSKHWSHIDVICPKAVPANTLKLFGNVNFHPSPLPKIFQPLFIAFKGWQISRNRKYALMTVHEYAPFLHGWGAQLLWLLRRIPFVSEFHHIEGYPHAANWKERLRRWLSGGYARWIHSKALKLRVVNRHETPGFLMAHGVPSSKLVYIPSTTLNHQAFFPQPLEKKFDLIYVGRLAANKGLLELLLITAKLRSKRPELKVLFVGTGPLRSTLENEAEKLGLEHNIQFWGWARSAEEIALLMNQSRVFVLNSRAEGGPRTPVEAMACGIPVATTPVGIMRDLIQPGINGVLLPWKTEEAAQAIEAMLDDPALQKKMGEEGRRSVAGFSREAVAANYASTYHQLVRAGDAPV